MSKVIIMILIIVIMNNVFDCYGLYPPYTRLLKISKTLSQKLLKVT